MDRNLTAVVFDMDGLIFNSEDLYDEALQALLEPRGIPYSRELKLQIMGKKASHAIEILRELTGITCSLEKVQSEVDELFLDCCRRALETMPGLETLLVRLETDAIPKAIATSSRRKVASEMLDRHQLTTRFEFVITGDDVHDGKPHPEIYQRAAARLGVAASEMLVLEDSESGTHSAVAAGAFTVAVPNRHTADCDFSHVHLVVESLDDPQLIGLIDRFGRKSANFS